MPLHADSWQRISTSASSPPRGPMTTCQGRIYRHRCRAKGTFVSTQNQDFIKEENLRRIEKLLSDAAALGRENGLTLEELKAALEVVYEDE